MAKLNAAARNALPASKFAGPDRSYPIPDASHAGNAKARASQAVAAGRMSKSTEAKIDAKANKVLGEHQTTNHPDHKAQMAAHAQHMRNHAAFNKL